VRFLDRVEIQGLEKKVGDWDPIADRDRETFRNNLELFDLKKAIYNKTQFQLLLASTFRIITIG
jgi:hypothetical protein